MIGRAVRQFGEDARFRQVRRGDGRYGEQTLAHGITDLILAQRAATAGTQHRVADQRNARQALHDLEYGLDHLDRAEHAQFDRLHRQVGDHRIGLGQYPVAVEYAEVADVHRVLYGQRGDRWRGMATLGEQGFDIGLQAGAATGVVTGQAKHYGAGVGRFHGARAYHQTRI